DASQVVGSAYTAGNVAHHAFLWQNGTMIDLGTLGGTQGGALSINDAGQAVGSSTPTAGNFAHHAFLWQNGTMIDLGTLGGTQSKACGINDAGQVVGSSTLTTGSSAHAFLWQNGTMIDLSTIGGTSEACGINDVGQVVGWSAQRAAMWILGPATPQEAVDALIEGVADLEGAGKISGEDANSLTNQLEAAAKMIGREAHEPAANLLGAFLHHLEAMMSSGRISQTDAQPLIDGAMELIEQLTG
ncbi:MAG TPA: hypothetical protein VEY33_03705, partial [Gemmatimonadota bacterium]|nr:hypothetical protein [Gemmatimonadota bacterium]